MRRLCSYIVLYDRLDGRGAATLLFLTTNPQILKQQKCKQTFSIVIAVITVFTVFRPVYTVTGNLDIINPDLRTRRFDA
jgi:uncharacterized protein with PQ loop repeat